MKSIIPVLLLMFWLSACSKNEDATSALQALTWQVGKNVYNEVIDGIERNFIVHVPEGYTVSNPVPLLLMLHGSSGNGNKFYNISGWVEKAEEADFIAVFPTALEYPIADKNNRLSTKWSSDNLISDVPEGTVIYDDIRFFEELLNILELSFSIDSQRIYFSGFSNGGGFIKSRVMESLNNRVAAVNTGGGIGIPLVQPISGRKIPLYVFTGTKDEGVIESSGIKEPVPLSAEELLKSDHYAQEIGNILEMLNIGESYSEESSPLHWNIVTFNDDLDGGGQEFKVMLVKDMTHVYPNGNNNAAGVIGPDIIWPWFTKFSLN